MLTHLFVAAATCTGSSEKWRLLAKNQSHAVASKGTEHLKFPQGSEIPVAPLGLHASAHPSWGIQRRSLPFMLRGTLCVPHSRLTHWDKAHPLIWTAYLDWRLKFSGPFRRRRKVAIPVSFGARATHSFQVPSRWRRRRRTKNLGAMRRGCRAGEKQLHLLRILSPHYWTRRFSHKVTVHQ